MRVGVGVRFLDWLNELRAGPCPPYTLQRAGPLEQEVDIGPGAQVHAREAELQVNVYNWRGESDGPEWLPAQQPDLKQLSTGPRQLLGRVQVPLNQALQRC